MSIRRLPLYVGLFITISLLSTIWSASEVWAAAPDVVTNVVPTAGDKSVTITWSNPSSVDFTGTMVRYSTSAFPTSTSDGTLVADVSGSPSGTSSTTVNSLSNGTIYYFSLFSHNSTPEYSGAINTQQLIMAPAFTETFQGLSTGTIGGQNGWTTLGGTWSVIDTAGEKTLQSSTTAVNYEIGRVVNGGSVSTYTDQMIRVDWKGSTTSTPGQVFLRAQSATADAAGYFLWQTGGTIRINYKSGAGAPQTQLASASFTPSAGTWYTYEFSVVNNSSGLPVLTGYVWQRGAAKPSTPTIQVTDTVNRFPQGVFSVGKTGTTAAEYDNVTFAGRIGLSNVTVTPGNQTNTVAWTNPTYANYAGAMVRASTSAFPSSISDGTLVANVTGSSGSTSSTMHSGLTNETLYYYTLFPYDSLGEYGAPIRLTQIAYSALFTDNFNASTIGTIVGQNGWTTAGGTWAVADVSGQRVLAGTNVSVTYPTNRALNGGAETTDQILISRFMSDSTTNTAGYVWLRYSAGPNGYLVWHSGSVWNISYYTGGVLTTLATAALTAAPPMEANAWFNQEVSVINNGSGQPVIKLYLWRDGAEKPLTPTLEATDSTDRFVSGSFGLGKNNSSNAYYDNVGFYGTGPALSITSPAAAVLAEPNVATRAIADENGTIYIPYIQTSTTLEVAASAGAVPIGGGVEFVLNEGLSDEQTVVDLTAPYSASFSGLTKKEHTLDAYVLDGDGTTRLPDAESHQERTDIAIGDIIAVVGDSIVEGIGGTVDTGTVSSWVDADLGTTSLDNRNFPQYGTASGTYNEGFLSDLNDKLAAYYGYPVFLMNEGRGGIRASNYQSTVMTAGWQSRELALTPNKWIVMLGINDNRVGDSPATFQNSITTLINTFISTYGATAETLWLPYPLYDFGSNGTPYANGLVNYPPVIDTVLASLSLQGTADLFHPFSFLHGTEYSDNVHPNATGYARLARLLALGMMKPTVNTPSVSGLSVTLSWNNLAMYESTVAGYRVNYGTSPTALTNSVTTTSTSTTINNLLSATQYYFSVEAYDDNPNYVSYSDDSAVVTATTDSVNSAPVFNGTISNFSFASGATSTLFDLDDYFSDADSDVLDYTVSGNADTTVQIVDGAVQMSTDLAFTGTEDLIFTASDGQGGEATSNTVVITITSGVTLDTVDAIRGESSGVGDVTVNLSDGSSITWTSFAEGGSLPRLSEINEQGYVFVTKYRFGSSVHVYSLTGQLLKKKRLSPRLHWRHSATGDLDGNANNEEMVVATRRGNHVYLKILSFKPNRNKISIIYRSQVGYGQITDNNFKVSVRDGKIVLKNSAGETIKTLQPDL